jgi:hypothetical protein
MAYDTGGCFARRLLRQCFQCAQVEDVLNYLAEQP